MECFLLIDDRHLRQRHVGEKERVCVGDASVPVLDDIVPDHSRNFLREADRMLHGPSSTADLMEASHSRTRVLQETVFASHWSYRHLVDDVDPTTVALFRSHLMHGAHMAQSQSGIFAVVEAALHRLHGFGVVGDPAVARALLVPYMAGHSSTYRVRPVHGSIRT